MPNTVYPMPYDTQLFRPEVDAFWDELGACDHCVQFYESDAAFLDTLGAFAASGIRRGDAIIVIGTASHRRNLEDGLESNGFDVRAAKERDQFICIDAVATLQRFMINGWPDDRLFAQMVAELLARAHRNHGSVRGFGEMVALLWADGLADAAVRLEQLWSHLCAKESLSIFCAYPKTGFTEDITAAMETICAAHSRVYVL